LFPLLRLRQPLSILVLCRFRARRLKAAKPDALHPVKIQENGREKGRISNKLARNCSVSCGFSPGHFPVFSLCPKACYISSQHSTRSLLGIISQVTSRGVGAGASGPCRRAREREALEPSLPIKFQFSTAYPMRILKFYTSNCYNYIAILEKIDYNRRE